MRAEADEAKVETEWLNLKRPNLGEDGGEFNLSSPCSSLSFLSFSTPRSHLSSRLALLILSKYDRRSHEWSRRSESAILGNSRNEELAQIPRFLLYCSNYNLL